MVNDGPSPTRNRTSWPRRIGTVVLYGLMLFAVLLLWNSHAPKFIYVAF